MTLVELIRWVESQMSQLPTSRTSRGRVKHLRALHAPLRGVGANWEFRRDWHQLAVKIAELTGSIIPEAPTSVGKQTAGVGRTPPKRQATTSARLIAARPKAREVRRIVQRPERPVIEVTPRLSAAFDAVTEGQRRIVFVTGGAGTGKSTFVRELRERLSDKNSIVLAPTGIAALNAGGQTIHVFCKLPRRPVMPTDVTKAKDRDLVGSLDFIVVDEISMVRADVLDGLDAFLRLNRNSTEAFGGLQMVFVGDLFQLPPVVTDRDEDAIYGRYATRFFFSAEVLKGRTFFPVELDKIFRQRDQTFSSLLSVIRDANRAEDAIRQINEACVGRELKGRYLMLVPTRGAADSENQARLKTLAGKQHTYVAAIDGSFARANEDRFPAPPKLELKVGAQVMFVRNDAERRWVNGTMGVVASLRADGMSVELEDGSLQEVEPVEWQDVDYSIDKKTGKVVEEVAGTFRQFPVTPAWAVTIHKAQGLTLDRVLVDLDRGAFAEGQVYVALSRCRTIDGLSLRRPIQPWEVRCSSDVLEFHRRINARRRSETNEVS